MDYNALVAVIDVGWAFCAVAVVATLGRFYIRWRSSTLDWDDLFNGLALATLIPYYLISDLVSVAALDTGPTTTADLEMALAQTMLMWPTLYFVKASFLALSRTIFKVSASFRKAWWVVTIYTFLTFWPLFLLQLWQCGSPSDYNNLAACSTFNDPTYNVASAAMSAAFHSSSELLILALPLAYIRSLHMRTVQKLSAAGIFAVAFINIVMGLIRGFALLCDYLGYEVDNSSNIEWVMQMFEPPIAVIICTMPAYKVLLKFQNRRKDSVELQRNAAPMGTTTPNRTKSAQISEALDSIAELERV